MVELARDLRDSTLEIRFIKLNFMGLKLKAKKHKREVIAVPCIVVQ